jgi:hypothetical protein
LITSDPTLSSAEVGEKIGISVSSARRVLREDLCLVPYKRRKVEALSSSAKQKRVSRSRSLLKRLAKGSIDHVLFSDE